MGVFLELIGILIVLAAFVIGTIALYAIHPVLGIVLGGVCLIAVVRMFSLMF